MTDTIRADFEAERKPPLFASFNTGLGIYVSTFAVSTADERRIRDYNREFNLWQKAHARYAPRENKNIIATVRANGDMSVGIWPFYHEIDTGYEELELEERELFKKTLTELYSEMCQEFAWVEFSDEAKALIATKEPQQSE